MAGIVHSALAPFTLKGFYLLAWGTALGTNVWHTISGLGAYRTLTRETFGHLQSALHPIYFATSATLTSSVLAAHLFFHPSLYKASLGRTWWWKREEGIQGLLILGALVPQLANLLFIGPQAINILYERHRQERVDGKEYDAVNPSDAMIKLNKRFSFIHGLSTGLNLLAGLSLAGLGLAVSV